MSRDAVGTLVDRWLNDPAFREQVRRNPEDAIRASGAQLDPDKQPALRGVAWHLSDEALALQARDAKVFQYYSRGCIVDVVSADGRSWREAALETRAALDWTGERDRVWRKVWPRFARAEMRVRSRRYLRGLLSGAARKNGWQLAEVAGEPTPDGMQELLNRAVWETDGVRDDLRAYVVAHLAAPAAVPVVDETGFLKQGTKSVGVQRQDSGTAGRIANCQIGVFLAYAAPQGHAFLDRALSLPAGWATDAARRTAAGVPPAIECQTKPQLAQAMRARARDAGTPASWVTGDEGDGGDRRLRMWLEAATCPTSWRSSARSRSLPAPPTDRPRWRRPTSSPCCPPNAGRR